MWLVGRGANVVFYLFCLKKQDFEPSKPGSCARTALPTAPLFLTLGLGLVLFLIVWQDANSALHKSPIRFFALYEFPYTSVLLEMRPAGELLCRCLYTPYVVVVVCCLEATALHCLVALCGCPCLVLAVLGCWPFLGRSSRFSVQMAPQAVASWGSASGKSAKQTCVSFGPVAN